VLTWGTKSKGHGVGYPELSKTLPSAARNCLGGFETLSVNFNFGVEVSP